jgi:hypothetical protein
MACVLGWSCNSNSGEAEKKERALYNDMADQLAWQFCETCNDAGGSHKMVWSNQRADSVKNSMRTQAKRRVLYYQPKIGATHKKVQLSDWFTVELSSWDRFNSTFVGTPPKDVLESITVSSVLEDLRIDYVDVIKLDTASQMQRDSTMAVVGFSKPFYKKDRNRAVVYSELACGAKGVRGDLLMMRHKENRWVIEERRRVWISKDALKQVP